VVQFRCKVTRQQFFTTWYLGLKGSWQFHRRRGAWRQTGWRIQWLVRSVVSTLWWQSSGRCRCPSRRGQRGEWYWRRHWGWTPLSHRFSQLSIGCWKRRRQYSQYRSCSEQKKNMWAGFFSVWGNDARRFDKASASHNLNLFSLIKILKNAYVYGTPDMQACRRLYTYLYLNSIWIGWNLTKTLQVIVRDIPVKCLLLM